MPGKVTVPHPIYIHNTEETGADLAQNPTTENYVALLGIEALIMVTFDFQVTV